MSHGRHKPAGYRPGLVLTRFENESIMIGDKIAITISSIRGDRVRVKISAPLNIAIHREEVYDAIAKAADQ